MSEVRRHARHLWLVIGLVSLSACAPRQSTQPTEEEVHAAAEADQHGPVLHLYKCRDGGNLFVSFPSKGLRLDVKDPSTGAALELRARAQGRAFEGGGVRATMHERFLTIEAPGAAPRQCLRQTTG